MSIAGYITRTELSLGNLNLHNPGSYRIAHAGPGPAPVERITQGAPYLHGEVQTSAKKKNGVLPLVVLVEGSSYSDLNTKVAALARALEQFAFQVSVTFDGVVNTWNCYMAEFETRGEQGGWEHALWKVKKQLFVCSIPRDPIPVSGAF